MEVSTISCSSTTFPSGSRPYVARIEPLPSSGGGQWKCIPAALSRPYSASMSVTSMQKWV